LTLHPQSRPASPPPSSPALRGVWCAVPLMKIIIVFSIYRTINVCFREEETPLDPPPLSHDPNLEGMPLLIPSEG